MLVAFADAYPLSYNSCGVEHSVSAAPQRVVTMNQGATELMLAMGLENHMAGTAYLDDYIWPHYATAYAQIPVLASSYPNESTIMSVNPDFIIASYNSAFRQVYESSGSTSGIFSDATVGPCTGTGSVFGDAKPTCRPQLHAANIGTYLFADACEDTSLRPATVTENTVYSEMRNLGSIFGVDPEPMITEMQADFESASAMVSSAMHGSPLKTVWLDCVDRCCSEDGQVFVGAGMGAPNMLMREAGLENVFKNTDGNWACVNVTDIVAADPDLLVVVDASWDSAVSKLKWLYNHSSFCNLGAMKAARFVHVPFSATTLSPRNGPAALDLAIAALHVRSNTLTAGRDSGVSSFNPAQLESDVEGLACTVDKEQVVYVDATDQVCKSVGSGSVSVSVCNDEVAGAAKLYKAWPLALAALAF